VYKLINISTSSGLVHVFWSFRMTICDSVCLPARGLIQRRIMMHLLSSALSVLSNSKIVPF